MTDNNNSNDTNNKLRLQETRGIITELYKINTEIIKPSKGGEGSPYIVNCIKRSAFAPSSYINTTTYRYSYGCVWGCTILWYKEVLVNVLVSNVHVWIKILGMWWIFWGVHQKKMQTKRIFAIHCGIYLRYHVLGGISLGECWTTKTTTNNEENDEDDNDGNSNGRRFCAFIDWHSLDRTDKSHKMSLFVVRN